jgi:hypothetical protein
MTIDGQPGKLTSPLALEYAERALQHHDINHAIEAIRIWSSPLPGLSEAAARVVRTSLFRDAIVQFVGCFDKSDKQYRLVREDVFPRTGSAEEYFQWLLALRDTFAAHRFGPLRQAVTGASVVGGAGGAVSVLMSLYLGPDATEAPRLLEFGSLRRTTSTVAFRSSNSSLWKRCRRRHLRPWRPCPGLR